MKIQSKLLILTFIILPIILIGLIITKYGVNTPYLDQWWNPGLPLAKFFKGELRVQQLFWQHMEARPVLPRLFFIGLANTFGWHPKLEMFVKLAFAGGMLFLIYLISNKTIKETKTTKLFFLGISSWLMFNAQQWRNWLWGFQITLFFPAACVILGCLALASNWHPAAIFIVCGLMATMATYSYVNGLLLWLIFFPGLLVLTMGKVRKRWWIPLAWTIWSTLIITNYFKDYEPTKDASMSSIISFIITQPKDFISFFFTGLGLLFGGYENIYLSIAFGSLIFFLSILGFAYLFWDGILRRNHKLLMASLPWLTLTLYSLLTWLSISLGRSSYGYGYSMSSHYIAYTCLLPIGLLYSAKIIFDDKPELFLHNRLFNGLIFLILSLLFFGYLNAYVTAFPCIKANHRSVLFEKACLMFSGLAQSERCIKEYYFGCEAESVIVFPALVDIVKSTGLELNSLEQLHPALLDNNVLDNFQSNVKTGKFGYFETFEVVESAKSAPVFVKGWAVLPDQGRPADAVVLTYQDQDDRMKVLQVARVGWRREDITHTNGIHDHLIGWQGEIDTDDLPVHPLTLSAWAFDAQKRSAYKLSGEFHYPLSVGI